MPDNLGDNTKYGSPWKQNVLTYDFQNYSSLWKETTITQVEVAFGAIESIYDIKFERVFDGSKIINIAFLTEDEKENENVKWLYLLKNDKKGNILAHGYNLQVRHRDSRAIYILIKKNGQLKILHLDVKDTTFFTLDYTKSAVVLAAFIKMNLTV